MVLLIATPGRADANGAFPDSLQILVPADHPHQIVLTTNFGLIISEDDGTTWTWACEPNPDDNAFLYQMGPAPSDRLFAILIANGLFYSDDLACTWKASGGSLATAVANDVFPDATNAGRVFVVATDRGDALTPPSVHRSDDGGLTFGPALYSAPRGGGMLGVESAFSQPATVYLAVYGTTTTTPVMLDPILVDSSDGGGHWTGSPLAPALGENGFRIIAVDRADPLRLFLRVTETLDEKLAVSIDGGKTFQEPVTVDDKLTSFVRLASGTILVGGNSSGGAVGFRSTDGGATFQSWPNPPHLRAMAERAGKLFVAADNFLDQFAVGVSIDEGLTFQPLLTYDQVKSIKPCLQAVCRDVCVNLAGLTLWPPEVCGAGGTTDTGSSPPAHPVGCGCRAAGGPAGEDGDAPAPIGGLLVVVLVVVLVAFRVVLRVVAPRRRRPPAGR